LEELRPDVETQMESRLSAAAGEPYIRGLIDDVRRDAVLPPMLRALAAWADTSGRYREFMILDRTEGVAEFSLVVSEWDDAERLALAALGISSLDAEFPGAIRRHMGASILRWWFLYYRAWGHGVFGPDARQASGQLDPRHVPAVTLVAQHVLVGR
jgi:hypothetical protein